VTFDSATSAMLFRFDKFHLLNHSFLGHILGTKSEIIQM